MNLSQHLELNRCPHCNIDKPLLQNAWHKKTTDHEYGNERVWGAYECNNCGGVVIAWARGQGEIVEEVFPNQREISEDLPDPARTYLFQALESLHAPAGAIMLAASSVDSML